MKVGRTDPSGVELSFPGPNQQLGMQFGRYLRGRSEMKALTSDPFPPDPTQLPDSFWSKWSGNTWGTDADCTPPGLR